MNFNTGKKSEVEINLTPLIDVVFLLLIFFMVSTRFVSDSSIQVQLPYAGKTDLIEGRPRVEVFLTENGELKLNDRLLGNLSSSALAKIFKGLAAGTDKELILSIHADSRVRYQFVMDVMDAARLAGIRKIAFATQNRRNK